MPNPQSTFELMKMLFKLHPELKLGWGSNLVGQGIGKAGAGQAQTAGHLGAIPGQGRGAAGRTFAIPTKTSAYGRARTIHEIRPDIQAFREHVKASDNPWFLAAIGTGRGRGLKSVDQASKDIATLVRDQGLFELENLAVSKKLLNAIHQPQNPLGIKLYESIANKNWHAPKQVVNREAIETAIQAQTKATPVKPAKPAVTSVDDELQKARKEMMAMTPKEIAAIDDPMEKASILWAQKNPEYLDEVEVVMKWVKKGEKKLGRTHGPNNPITKEMWNTLVKWRRTEGHPMASSIDELVKADDAAEELKVISGMQIGADQIGLRVAKAAGVKTGGTAPPGFQTSHGANPKLAKEYGIVEGVADPNIYKLRTLENVKNSDGTIIVANDWSSGGTKLTQRYLKQERKPSLLSTDIKEPWDVINWMQKHQIQTINIAGNRLPRAGKKGVDDKHPAWMHILNALKEMKLFTT